MITGNRDAAFVADELLSNLAHLYRRAGFGARHDELRPLMAAGYNAAVEGLLAMSGPDQAADVYPRPLLESTLSTNDLETLEERKARTKTRAEQRRQLALWWVQRMSLTSTPLREKLTFFWHGHFATSIDKVNEASFMLAQNEIFRSLGAGSFETLAQTVAKDPAMMIWLDSNQNRKGSPNENFARELMELFTIGIGSYTDADVRDAARAFTGWRINRKTAAFSVVSGQHDSGAKSLLGTSGPFGGEEVISLLATHPSSARFVASKLWSSFAFPVLPEDPIVTDLAPAFAVDRNITGLLRAIFRHPEFVSTRAKQGLVKQPAEWMAGSLRALRILPSGARLKPALLLRTLSDLNQVPFDPPSVGGWPQNGYWISTATALARLSSAEMLVKASNLDWLVGVSSAQRPDAIAAQLGVDGWTSSTNRAMQVASSPSAQLTVALVSPEYILN